MKPSLVPAVFRRKSQKKPETIVQQKTISHMVVSYQNYLDEMNRAVPEQFIEKYQETGIVVSPEELNELCTFQMFISSQVKPNNIFDTPCMLLWAEWVRFCLKEMHTFPCLILEKEFRDLVMNQFGCTVSDDEARGRVYPGIQFVPKKTISLNVIDRESARA